MCSGMDRQPCHWHAGVPWRESLILFLWSREDWICWAPAMITRNMEMMETLIDIYLIFYPTCIQSFILYFIAKKLPFNVPLMYKIIQFVVQIYCKDKLGYSKDFHTMKIVTRINHIPFFANQFNYCYVIGYYNFYYAT